MSAVSGRKFHKSEQQQQQQIYQPNGINQQNEELTPRRMAKKMLSPYMYLVRSSLGQDEEDKRKSPNKNSLKQTPERKKLSIQQLQATQEATTAPNTATTTLKKKKYKVSPAGNSSNSNNINVSDYNAERSEAIETFKGLSNSGASALSKRKKSPLREVLEDRNQDLEKERLVMIGCITKIKELREKYFGQSEAFFIEQNGMKTRESLFQFVNLFGKSPNENAKHSFDKEYCALELCLSQQQEQSQFQQMDNTDNPQISKREVDKRMAEKEHVIQELQKAIHGANSELSAVSNELINQRQAVMDKQIQITQLADTNMKFQRSLQEYKKLEEYGTMNEIVQKEIEALKGQKNDFEKKYYELKTRVQTLQGLKEENTMLKLELDHRVKDLKVENEKLLREYSLILKDHTFFRAKCKQLEEDLEESNRKNQSLVSEKRNWQMNSLKVPAGNNRARDDEIAAGTLDARMEQQQQQRRYNTEGLQPRQMERVRNANNSTLNNNSNNSEYQQTKGYPQQEYARGVKQQQQYQQQTLQPQQQYYQEQSRGQKEYSKPTSGESRDGSRIRNNSSNNNNTTTNSNSITRNPAVQNRQLLINEAANYGQRDNTGNNNNNNIQRNDEESRRFSNRLYDKKREQSAGREGIKRNRDDDNSSQSSSSNNNRGVSREKQQQQQQQSQLRGASSNKRAASQQPPKKNDLAAGNGGESKGRSRETSLINDIQQSVHNSVRVPAGYQYTQKKDNNKNNMNSNGNGTLNGRSSIGNTGQQIPSERNQPSLIKEIPVQITISPIKNKESSQQQQQQSISRLEDQGGQSYESPQKNSIKGEQVYQQQAESSSKEVTPQIRSGVVIRQENKLNIPVVVAAAATKHADGNDNNISNMNNHTQSSSHIRASQAAYELRTLTLEEKMEELQRTNEELRERIEHQEKALLSYQRERQEQGKLQGGSEQINLGDSSGKGKDSVIDREGEKNKKNKSDDDNNDNQKRENDDVDERVDPSSKRKNSNNILVNGMKHNSNNDGGNLPHNNASLHGYKSSSMSMIQQKEAINNGKEQKDNFNKSAVNIQQQQEFSFDAGESQQSQQQQQQYLQVNNNITKGIRNPSKLQQSEEIDETGIDQQLQRQAQGRADQALIAIDIAGESRASRNSNN